MSNVTYAVVIEIDNSDGSLSSGSSATVTFLADDTSQQDTEAEAVTEEAAAPDGTEVVEETEETGGME